MIGIGLLGYGYWGPNLARNVAETPGARLVAVADPRAERCAGARARHPGVRTTTDAGDLIADPAVDAVVVATPPATHAALVLAALRAGKPVLVEKPLATTSTDAARLVDEAAARGLVLMVDHTFVYTSAVRTIRALVSAGEIGEVHQYDAVRTNLAPFQPDVGVLWDLAVHDLAVLDFVLGAAPEAVSAVGLADRAAGPPDVAYLALLFGGRRIAHVHASWLGAVKIRRTLVSGRQGTIVWDDLEPSEKVKVYQADGARSEAAARPALRTGFRAGDVWVPRLEDGEALRRVAAHFVRCVETGERPETDGEAGWRVIRLLEAATASLARHGEPVRVASTPAAVR